MKMFSKEKKITFHVGGVEHSVNTEEVGPETTLNTYLREKLNLTGTKRMCLEGGCGVCVVAIEAQHPKDGKKRVLAVNSCLVALYSCHGWHIYTNEGIGGPLKGYNKVQQTLASFNGSQCGFCSSGMVMNMFALYESGPVTKAQVEDAFGSNICRCTGYRPILDAFKSLATDHEELTEIEDLKPCKMSCTTKCQKTCKNKTPLLYQSGEESKWMKVYNLHDLLEVLSTVDDAPYQLVAGNTARGVYKPIILPKVYIDVTDVEELTTYKLESNLLTIGGNYTLTATIALFRSTAKSNKGFWYLDKMADHIEDVAHIPVRNIGTIAGNLMTKHQHNEFQSDIFLIMETANATLVIVDNQENETHCTPHDFIKLNMNKKVLKSVMLTTYNQDEYVYTSYKIARVAQNSVGIINAGFLFKMTNGIVSSARIIYGAINPKFVHATNTEKLLKNKNLFDDNVLKEVFKSLDSEIQPNYVLPDPSPAFRKQLALGLFYKFVLSIVPPDKTLSKYKSGGPELSRPISSGVQVFGTDKKKWPLGQPIGKIEALAQCSGQAQYIADIPDRPYQQHACFVTAQAIAGSEIKNIDASEALKMNGVTAFFDKSAIPGRNSFAPKSEDLDVQEEIFCNGKVQYYFQPIGIIVATTYEVAVAAADLVKVTYTPPKTKPLLTIRDVFKAKANDRIKHLTTFVRKRKGTNVQHVIKGEFYMGQQYHYHMEVQCCNVVPTEDGMDIYAATQWMDVNQCAAAEALNMPSQKINVFVRRLGGGYGGKISRNALPSCAAAIAAYKLRKPVKMWMPFTQNMDVIGKRYPLLVDYEAGVDNKGVMQYFDAKLYTDYGVGGNEVITYYIASTFQNGYDTSTWQFDMYMVNTDTYPNTWARAPGTLEGEGAIETIMEHIAAELGVDDPFDVKMANIDKPKWPKLVQFIGDMLHDADIAKRRQEIKAFNAANRWKKKGMSVVPLIWTLDVVCNFTVYVAIMHADGGVAIIHGGIEIGQGINTKVVQVCAYKFGIPIEKVQVKPSYNVVTPNSSTTGGSLTSETVVYALLKACDTLLDRIKPVRDKMKGATWEQIIKKCFDSNIQLSATGFFSDTDKHPGLKPYPIFGVCASEVEVDILTGQHQILRVDIIEDVGDSMSPLVDMGQVEGAFVMGIGYYTTEELIFDADGRLLTNRSWNYKPPGAKDIPIDFRISFPKNNPNPEGVLNSKAIAEPPICLSVAIPMAIRNALASARADADKSKNKWYPVDGTSTVENTLLNTLNNFNHFVYK